MALIYLIRNKINQKGYVGKTVRSLNVRWGAHVGSARRHDTGMLVTRAISKHGEGNFDVSVVEECSVEMLNDREQFWIRKLHTHVDEGGYNLTYGGDGGLLGYHHTNASKEKMRQKAVGRKHSPEVIKRIADKRRGIKQSAASNAKRSATMMV